MIASLTLAVLVLVTCAYIWWRSKRQVVHDNVEESEVLVYSMTPPEPELLRDIVRDLTGNPCLMDSGGAKLGAYYVFLDGCMDWSGVYIRKLDQHGYDDWTQAVYRAYQGINNNYVWESKWETSSLTDIEEVNRLIDIWRKRVR